ncbi:MAG: substrate-binding domain-containing protein [Acidothermus sp.]|nr:substrate-binding domain-containing protein [Acidothermus sp.]MCL6538904.1 substrate-binding domain-containing protein [Acidothermus sp.]
MKGKPRLVAAAAIAAAASLVVSACSSSKSSSPTSGSSANASASSGTNAGGNAGGKIQAALILKEFTNPYWISMENAAKAEAAKLGVDLHVSAGKADDDATSQIQQIDAAISAGYKGIIIAINSDAVNTALQRAKAAGLLVVVVDTPPIPASIADVTYATDNLQAGLFIGKWMAQKLNGADADIAMLDDLANQVITVDVDRDHGFLQGMGIPVGNPNMNGQEPKSGHYTGGKGGNYKIACQLPTNGSATGGLSAMETCLSKDPNINVVYTINEPAAKGAAQALKNAGKTATIVTIDGSCNYLSLLASGQIGADSEQFPGKMAQLGVDAIAQFAKTGTKPTMPAGKDFINTGVQLITAQPQPGVDSVTPDQAKSTCWG